GPRRAVNVAPLVADLRLPCTRNAARATIRMIAPIRQRGCRRMKAMILFGFGIGDFLPLTVFLDEQNAEVIPEHEPGDGVSDQRLGELVFGADQVVLRVHLVLGLGSAEFGQEILFLHAPFGDFDADFADFVVAFGLVEGAPAVADIEFDLIGLQFEGAAGGLVGDEGGPVGIALGFAFQREIDVQAGVPVVAVEVGYSQAGGGLLFAVEAGGGDQVDLGAEGVGGDADLAPGIL